MAAIYDRSASNPLLLSEIVGMVVDNVHMVRDLLSCACVCITWSAAALKKLYRGSLIDMQFRTPDIGSLNCLFVASRERFRRNMGFVKHLLLSPESPAIDEALHPDTRHHCIEKCRAMRHRHSAELLLRPNGEGLTSLTIPFEIEGQDWSLICELLPRTIEFLAIDDYYCELLMDSSNYFQEMITSTHKFLNLKALTIYRSSSFQHIDHLCRLLECCDLEFFHIEEPHDANSLTEDDKAELLLSLRSQESLQALALTIPRWPLPLGLASTTLTNEEQRDLWPSLKMLSLGVADRHWLEQFPRFEKLQILCLQMFTPSTPITSQNAIQKIAKCRHLRVVDINFFKLSDSEALLDIARGCPLLQKFSVKGVRSCREPEKLCIDLLHALPRLEYFEFDLRFRMDGAGLQDLARHCSQLTVLELPRARLCLSLTLLTEAHPFQQLEVMHFERIFFENPRRTMRRHKIRGIAAEWRRVFPKLRVMPCPTDRFSPYLNQDDLNEESEGDSVSADDEMSLREPGLDFDDYDSDWYILRTKLWKVLGYPVINDSIQNMWQKNLEIEITGWPVVPLRAFSRPGEHSTTA